MGWLWLWCPVFLFSPLFSILQLCWVYLGWGRKRQAIDCEMSCNAIWKGGGKDILFCLWLLSQTEAFHHCTLCWKCVVHKLTTENEFLLIVAAVQAWSVYIVSVEQHSGSICYLISLLLLWLVGNPRCCKAGLSPPTGSLIKHQLAAARCIWNGWLLALHKHVKHIHSDCGMALLTNKALLKSRQPITSHPRPGYVTSQETISAYAPGEREMGLWLLRCCCLDCRLEYRSQEAPVCETVTWRARQHSVPPQTKPRWPLSSFPKAELMFTYSPRASADAPFHKH